MRRGPGRKDSAQSQLCLISVTTDSASPIKLGNPWLVFFSCHLDFL